MRKFTFIVEYRGGTYISQYMAPSIIEAFRIWAKNLDLQNFPEKEKNKILKILDEDLEDLPTPIDEVDNVWHHLFIVYRRTYFINVVETV